MSLTLSGQVALRKPNRELLMEFSFPIHLGVAPMVGDSIQVADQSVTVQGEFTRLPIGKDRFYAEAADGNVYEIDVLDPGNGMRGTQRWKSARVVPRSEFVSMSRVPAL
jgi:hypothetical protein